MPQVVQREVQQPLMRIEAAEIDFRVVAEWDFAADAVTARRKTGDLSQFEKGASKRKAYVGSIRAGQERASARRIKMLCRIGASVLARQKVRTKRSRESVLHSFSEQRGVRAVLEGLARPIPRRTVWSTGPSAGADGNK